KTAQPVPAGLFVALGREVCYQRISGRPLPVPEEPPMKKSIMRGTLPRTPALVKLLEPLKKAGFDGVQLGIMDPPAELTLRSTDAEVAKLAQACRDAGIEPHSVYGGVRFFQEDEAGRRQTVEDGKRVIDIAAGLGARTWLIHPGQLSPEVPYDACWKYTLDCLGALKTKAESTHLRVGLENVWNKFLMSPLEFLRVIEEVHSP